MGYGAQKCSISDKKFLSEIPIRKKKKKISSLFRAVLPSSNNTSDILIQGVAFRRTATGPKRSSPDDVVPGGCSSAKSKRHETETGAKTSKCLIMSRVTFCSYLYENTGFRRSFAREFRRVKFRLYYLCNFEPFLTLPENVKNYIGYISYVTNCVS